ncbi:MAG: sigma-E factor negative regulatory protein [Burkholderiaceae bacterium]|nr:sigma-E factor negative regulatory protein [Burkholderiaceae bacterium]
MQSTPDNSAGPHRQALSLLMDGELPPGEAAAALAGFRHDLAVRADWHAYHLIGDVLRSEDLAVAPAHDERFLQALRGRLAQEPAPSDVLPLVALAPGAAAEPAPAASPRRRAANWLVAPAAVAAGFVAVAAVLVVNKAADAPPAAAPVIARAPAAAVPATTLIRDAQLDRYLAAHRNLGTGVAGAGGAERTVQIVYEPK